jgi:hypothetical protein
VFEVRFVARTSRSPTIKVGGTHLCKPRKRLLRSLGPLLSLLPFRSLAFGLSPTSTLVRRAPNRANQGRIHDRPLTPEAADLDRGTPHVARHSAGRLMRPCSTWLTREDFESGIAGEVWPRQRYELRFVNVSLGISLYSSKRLGITIPSSISLRSPSQQDAPFSMDSLLALLERSASRTDLLPATVPAPPLSSFPPLSCLSSRRRAATHLTAAPNPDPFGFLSSVIPGLRLLLLLHLSYRQTSLGVDRC